MRELAHEKGLTIDEFEKIIDEKTERDIDQKTWEIGKSHDNIIFDGRLAFYFIPDSFKIFLDVDFEEGARRIFPHQRSTEKPANTLEELISYNKHRWEEAKNRYIKRYQVNIDDLAQYHYVLNTTGLPLERVVAEIDQAIRMHEQENH